MRLRKPFFISPDVVQTARDLLGKFLVTDFAGGKTAGMIVETEAYRAPDDRGCHAYLNRRTKRTEIMFAEGGKAYVYLCYGIHHLFNIVTGEAGMAQAVLVRAVEPADNLELMLARRNMEKTKRQLCAGPGVLTQALGIRTEHSGTDLLANGSPIWVEDRGIRFSPKEISATPRVGIAFAKECANWPWRFRVENSKWTSKPDRVSYP